MDSVVWLSLLEKTGCSDVLCFPASISRFTCKILARPETSVYDLFSKYKFVTKTKSIHLDKRKEESGRN